MAPTTFSNGTQTATVGTEHFKDVNEAGTFIFTVDLHNMAAGDFVILRAKKMTLTGGTARGAYIETFQGVQPDEAKIAISVPISNVLTDSTAIRFSIEQQRGAAGRDFPWTIEKHA